MNSKRIIALVTEIILNEFKDNIEITFVFQDWIKSYIKIKDNIKENFFSKYQIELIELKNDALKKIMNNVYKTSLNNGMQKWDRDYVRNKYEKIIEGCDVVYYPSKVPKRILFNFSSMGKDRYDRYSRYWDEKELWENDTAYVFFKDDNYQYYLGNQENPKSGIYFKLIKDFCTMNDLNLNQAFTVGGSMGGYAALYYAISLELNGAIVCAPQTTFKATLAHEYRNWEKHIKSISSVWVDLDMLLHRVKKTPNIYIEYGNYMSDKIAVDSFVEELRRKNESLLIIRKAKWENHTVDTVLSYETINNTIWYFENNGFIF